MWPCPANRGRRRTELLCAMRVPQAAASCQMAPFMARLPRHRRLARIVCRRLSLQKGPAHVANSYNAWPGRAAQRVGRSLSWPVRFWLAVPNAAGGAPLVIARMASAQPPRLRPPQNNTDPNGVIWREPACQAGCSSPIPGNQERPRRPPPHPHMHSAVLRHLAIDSLSDPSEHAVALATCVCVCARRPRRR